MAAGDIDGKTRVCGLIGNPVEHTLSPDIHNTLARFCGVNLAYVPFYVEKGLAGDAVRGAWALNILGLNVTVPYKSEVIPFCSKIDPLAEKIGAVNTLVRTDGGFLGYNTDMTGLYRAMQEDGVRLEGEEVILLGAGGVGAVGVVFFLVQKGYVEERLAGWLDPFSDILNSTMQTAQSLYTIASGGLFGVGIGNSMQKNLWLPEAQNDFIFAVLCEELGFVGACLCIGLFVAFIIQCAWVSMHAPDRYGALLGIGITAQIAWQVFLNIAVVTNTIPNTGISLPFFSSGGTSLTMLLAQMGVLFSICRAGNANQALQRQLEKERQAAERAQREAQQKARRRDFFGS